MILSIDQAFVDRVMPSRDPQSNKNDFGRILCICGSRGYTGAAFFAAQGAVRMGSGVVTLAVPEAIYTVTAVKLNEPVVQPLPCDKQGRFSIEALPALLQLANKADAVLIGCGLGRSDELTMLLRRLLPAVSSQLILDADGINGITSHIDVLRSCRRPPILTPHAGEFSRCIGGVSVNEEKAAGFAAAYRCIVLLKAHRTFIAASDGRCFRNTSGNPGMAKGGSGDVLAGILTSLCGQGLSALDAACVAAWLHGRAGDLCANRLSEYGMTPTDLLGELPPLLRRYNSREW